jgi:hypothetical protein
VELRADVDFPALQRQVVQEVDTRERVQQFGREWVLVTDHPVRSDLDRRDACIGVALDLEKDQRFLGAGHGLDARREGDLLPEVVLCRRVGYCDGGLRLSRYEEPKRDRNRNDETQDGP